MPDMVIREINPSSADEINLVAARMRDTLIEVEGREIGEALYSIEWLRDRVKWHLNPIATIAQIFLAINVDGQIIGHTIVRKEFDIGRVAQGLFSTTYVIPSARKVGTARQLLLAGERWMIAQSLPSAATWTSKTNLALIALYTKHGYAKVAQHLHDVTGTMMVKLEKQLCQHKDASST